MENKDHDGVRICSESNGRKGKVELATGTGSNKACETKETVIYMLK